MLKIIGLDPGLSDTGIAVIQGESFQVSSYSFGSITTDKNVCLGARLDTIYTKIIDFLDHQKPDLIVLEDVFSLEKYPGSGIVLGKVSGVLLLAAFRSGTPVEEISVREVKKIVSGSGSADKYQVEKSVRTFLNHPDPIRPFHASDALALALSGFFRCGRQA